MGNHNPVADQLNTKLSHIIEIAKRYSRDIPAFIILSYHWDISEGTLEYLWNIPEDAYVGVLGNNTKGGRTRLGAEMRAGWLAA
jgi:hypothetical protein